MNRDIVEAGRATRFRPGQSGNPRGRPRRKHVTDALLRELEQASPSGQGTNARAIAHTLVRLATDGDVPAAKLILEYTEGKPVQPVDVELRQRAQRIATSLGLDTDELIRTAELIVAGHYG